VLGGFLNRAVLNIVFDGVYNGDWGLKAWPPFFFCRTLRDRLVFSQRTFHF